MIMYMNCHEWNEVCEGDWLLVWRNDTGGFRLISFIYRYADDVKIMNCVSDEFDHTFPVWLRHTDKVAKGMAGVKWCILAEETETVHTQWMVILARCTHLNRLRNLGIWLDRSLKFSAHVARATNKAHQILGLIQRSFTYIHQMSMKQLYIALVRPHLEYGINVVWHPYLKRDIAYWKRYNTEQQEWFRSYNTCAMKERLKIKYLHNILWTVLHWSHSVNQLVVWSPVVTVWNFRKEIVYRREQMFMVSALLTSGTIYRGVGLTCDRYQLLVYFLVSLSVWLCVTFSYQ